MIPRISDAFSPEVNALRLIAFAILLLAVAAAPAAAQQRGRPSAALATGDVRHVTPTDSLPVRNALVVLHRVFADGQGGAVDSAVTDRQGRFRIPFRPDTMALFLVSTRYSGIEYFSPPIRLDPGLRDRSVTLYVYDTSSTTPVQASARHIVVGRPGPEGFRTALELLFLRNVGSKTRIPRDSLAPTWGMALPPDMIGFDVTGGEVSPQALTVRNDSLLLAATVVPGERQLIYQYGLPVRTRITIPVSPQTETLNLLLEEADARVETPGMTPVDTQVIEGRSYRRWAGSGVGGNPLVIQFADPRGTARVALIALVATLGAAVVVILVVALRRGQRERSLATTPTPAALIDALAQLDAVGESGLSPDAERERQAERARLRALLDAALAERAQRR